VVVATNAWGFRPYAAPPAASRTPSPPPAAPPAAAAAAAGASHTGLPTPPVFIPPPELLAPWFTHPLHASPPSEVRRMQKLRIVRLGFGTARQKLVLER
jgi:hypothetical protein